MLFKKKLVRSLHDAMINEKLHTSTKKEIIQAYISLCSILMSYEHNCLISIQAVFTDTRKKIHVHFSK